ncbi:hypothetical protein FVE89_30685 [Methylobacterium sp. 2A]|uniref:hypothetical protein n=1 Tax=Methylobacterium sp. 2A TaxID=2603816 RepID=UPI0013537B99|nr:hypothetical protein [Methylobacterium sp. 2A]MWV26262.1 hypothetical protein [Methylobacterium sp. 2A]
MRAKPTSTAPGDDAPWTPDRLGGQLLALAQTVDALVRTAEDHTKMLQKVLEAAAAPAESSEFSPLNRNLKLIARLLDQNGDLLSVICRQVGASLPAKP